MKKPETTHDIAYSLRKLATTLLEGPDVPVSKLFSQSENKVTWPKEKSSLKQTKKQPPNDLIGVFVSISSVTKKEWLDVLSNAGIVLNVRPRDGARDIMGQVFVMLKNDPEKTAKLKNSLAAKESDYDSELSRSLKTLLDIK